jgi:RNA polymerase sigma-70 factor (ECF subfamily)
VSIDAVEDLDALNVMIDDISPERRTSAHQELRRLAEAIDQLPPKCRETIWLRRVDDLSQKEVAEKLGIAQKTVEKHVMKGMKLLAAALFRNEGGISPREKGLIAKDSELEHGKPQTG